MSLRGTDILLNPLTCDIDISSGDLCLVNDVEGIAQHLRQRLSFFLGEWFLAVNQGVPWFQLILVKNPNFSLIEITLRNVVLNTPGIILLNTFNFGFNTRTRGLSISLSANTINGELNFSEIIEA